MANRCGKGLDINPYATKKCAQMRCLCVVHRLKDITVVAIVLSVFCVLSFTLSIWFFYARSLLMKLENQTQMFD